jgi:hypothetical protein
MTVLGIADYSRASSGIAAGDSRLIGAHPGAGDTRGGIRGAAPPTSFGARADEGHINKWRDEQMAHHQRSVH